MKTTSLPLALAFLLASLNTSVHSEPLTLAAAQALLLRENPDVLLQRQEQTKTAEQLREARSAYWPSLDVSGSYQILSETNRIHMDLPAPFPPVDKTLGDHDREEYGVDLTYPLFLGGASQQQVLAREASGKAQAMRTQATENQLSLRLAALYYAWQSAESARSAQDTLVGYYGDYARHIAAVVKNGSGLRSRELAARAKLLNAETDQMAAADFRDSIGRAAALLLGLPPSQPIVFAPDDDTPAHSGSIPVAERPELKSLQLTSESLTHQEKVLDGQRWPSLVGMLGYRIANPGLNLGSNDYMNYGLAGLQLRWNLFDGFKNRSQRAQAQSQLESLRIEQNRQTAFWDEAVTSAEHVVSRLELAAQAAQAGEDAAKLTLQETQAQHDHGVASDLDLLDAQVARTQAGLRLRQIGWQRKSAAWQLRFARGENLRLGE